MDVRESLAGAAENVPVLGATGEVRDELSELVGERPRGGPLLSLSCAAVMGFRPVSSVNDRGVIARADDSSAALFEPARQPFKLRRPLRSRGAGFHA